MKKVKVKKKAEVKAKVKNFLNLNLNLNLLFPLSVLLLLMMFGGTGHAEGQGLPSITIGFGDNKDGGMVISLQVLILLTILSLVPAILIMMTSFTRIIVVLSFLRQALGTQQIPSNQVLISLALFLTFFVMGPAWQKINSEALQPYLSKKITQEEAINKGIVPMREFMLRQTSEKDLGLFVSISNTGDKEIKTPDDIPTYTIMPAFIISELRKSFQIGFIIFIPFLIIDMVVASLLMSMGMMMLPPIVISMPFKLILFVLVDGWYLVVGSLVKSFN